MESWSATKAHELRSLSQLHAYIPNATTVRRRLLPSLEVDDPELADLTSETRAEHSFSSPVWHKVVKDTVYWARRYDKDHRTQTANDPIAMAPLIAEVAATTSAFIVAKWTGQTSVKLALRHTPEEIAALVDTYSQHPIFSGKKCRHIIAAHVGEPENTLASITEYFRVARTEFDIMQLSNTALFDSVTMDDIRQGNFGPVLEAEFSAYKPLSTDPESALDQLRDTGRGKTQTEATIQSIGSYVESVLANSFNVLSAVRRLSLRPSDLAGFAERYAIYADSHDYNSLSTEQICATAQEHLFEIQGIALHGIKPALASKLLLNYTPNYLAEFFTVARQEHVGIGRSLGILKKWCSDPLWQLHAICTLRDDLVQRSRALTSGQGLQLALNTIGSEKYPQEICNELQLNIAHGQILYGNRLSNSFITKTCIESPNNCTDILLQAHVRVGKLYIDFDDPCLPRGFLQELVEKTDKKTLTWRALAYHSAIRAIRREHADWTNQQIWAEVRIRVKRDKNIKTLQRKP